jgi:hypothetical protein
MDTETVDEFGLVNDDDQLLTGARNDLFMQQSAAATLQKMEPADIDFVCPIDCDVDVIMLRWRGERDPQATRLSLRLL